MPYFIAFLLCFQVVIAKPFDQIHLDGILDSSGGNGSSLSDAFTRADKLYKDRGIDMGKAREAINLYYENLGTPGRDNALRYIQLARMEFYTAQFMEKDESLLGEQVQLFQSSFENAGKAGRLFHQQFREFPQDLGHTEALVYAQAIYVYTLGLSQWAKLKGTFVILRKWPEIRDINQTLIDNAFGHLDYYGPYRVIGLAHNEMPPIAGGNPQIARQYLKMAFDNTLIDRGISAHVYNNIAYATRFLKDGKREQGCEIVNKSRLMFRRDFQRVAPDRVPESLAEKKQLMEIWLKNTCYDFE